MRRADPFTVCNIKGTSGSPIFWLIISVDCCKEASDAMGMVFSRQSLVSLTWSIGVDMVVKRWFPLQSDGGGGGGGCRGARRCRRQVGHRHLDSVYSNGASSSNHNHNNCFTKKSQFFLPGLLRLPRCRDTCKDQELPSRFLLPTLLFIFILLHHIFHRLLSLSNYIQFVEKISQILTFDLHFPPQLSSFCPR